jgi:tetratricopeptide (TPR) repeat protein
MKPHSNYCPDARMSVLMASVGADTRRGMRDLEAMLQEYPQDARLHFLKGSLLAGEQDYSDARVSMRHAVDLAPNFHVARFQLGFLLLTSGESLAAQEAWGPLHALPDDNYLHLFVRGLSHLIRDEFGETIKLLQTGIARNTENPAMNRDMELILEKIRNQPDPGKRDDARTSSVDFLLQQAALKPRH